MLSSARLTTAYDLLFSLALPSSLHPLTYPLSPQQWLINRAELARVDPRYAYPQPSSYTTYRPEYYNMQPNMAPPPPMYDPRGRPPMYDGPQGGTKTAPSQWTQGPTHRPDEEYGAPSGPPPAQRLAPENTGSTNPYRV